MSVAIKVEDLSKAYQIGQIGTGTISRDLERWWVTSVMGKQDPFLKVGEENDRTVVGKSNVIWSLRDINLEIEQGEAVGIIGRNGAGKSTLLKLLSRVTAPTTGRIKIKGRVASLLEVGTGFHPELTGRENIYLNGSILGMRKKEIDRKLDAIVDFSGVERYIDTPVKRYSSGMSVRLAFAVAAHLESEILIVDEVLAVGDAEFQKKCIGKMGEIGKKNGKTVLFVSHNMGAVQELCKHGIQIDKGKIVFEGNMAECIGNYYHFSRSVLPESGRDRQPIVLGDLTVNESMTPSIESGESVAIKAEFIATEIENPRVYIILENALGQTILHESIQTAKIGYNDLHGHYSFQLELPPLWLSPGVYSLYAKFLLRLPTRRVLSDRIMLQVKGQFDNTGKTLLRPTARWKIEETKTEPSTLAQ